MTKQSLANQLGALALALSDAQQRLVTDISGVNDNASALLTVLGLNPDETIRDASNILALSHSATVRLVGQLALKGLVERLEGEDRREVHLRLTRRGRQVRSRILEAREALLTDAISGLSEEEHVVAKKLVAGLLGSMTEDEGEADRICRFCDEEICDPCPFEGMCRADGEHA